MNYPGGKGAEGVYQAIINQTPPHGVYIEPFLGGGAVLRYKRPADITWACEIDPVPYEAFEPGDGFHPPATLVQAFGHSEQRVFCDRTDTPSLFIWRADALKFLRDFMFQGSRDHYFIYLDPPYLKEMRSSSGKCYNKDFSTWFEHEELLALLPSLNANVMISGYDHPLYNGRLPGWRKASFTGVTRGGPKTETIWMNYPEPVELHDYRYLGKDYREREAIKRQTDHLVGKFGRLTPQRQYALKAAVDDYFARLAEPTFGDAIKALMEIGSSPAEKGGAAAAENMPATIAPIADGTGGIAQKGEPREIDAAGYVGRDHTQHPVRNGADAQVSILAEKGDAGSGKRKKLKSEIGFDYLVDHYFYESDIEEALTDSDPVEFLRKAAIKTMSSAASDGISYLTIPGSKVQVTIGRTTFVTGLRKLAKRVLDLHAAGAPAEAEMNWPPSTTTNGDAGSLKFYVDPKRLHDNGDIARSLSADKIMTGQVRQPFQFESRWWIGTSGYGGGSKVTGWTSVQAHELVPVADYAGPTYTYGQHNALPDDHPDRWNYNGMLVTYKGAMHVLVGPQRAFMQDASATDRPPTKEAVVDVGTFNPRSIACPSCFAKAGSPCRRPSGHNVFGGDFHAGRKKPPAEVPQKKARASSASQKEAITAV